jgi:hypothetical protein
LLQIKRSGEVREERRIKRERIEERVGAQAHRGRRIQAEKPTGPADLQRDISLIWRCFDRGGKEGRRRGNRGLYRRGLCAGEARVFGRGDRTTREADVLRRVSWLEADGDPTGGAHLSVEEREGRIPFRVWTELGRGRIRGWAELVPLGLFTIFLFLFFFFSVSYLFHNFCNIASNPLKPISIIF